MLIIVDVINTFFHSRLDNPPGSAGVSQLSATPRHILSVTDMGECWTNEEGKVGGFNNLIFKLKETLRYKCKTKFKEGGDYDLFSFLIEIFIVYIIKFLL